MQSNLLLRHCPCLLLPLAGRRALCWEELWPGVRGCGVEFGSVLLGQISSPPNLILFLYKMRQGIGSRTLVDTKIHGCSSPLYKISIL